MPSPLARIEQLLSGLIEGSVERFFPDRLQPARLARALEAAMEDGAIASAGARLAPSTYLVRLDTATFERVSPALLELRRDLEVYVEEVAQRRGLRPSAMFEVHVEADRYVEAGRFEVEAAFPEHIDEDARRAPGIEITQAMPVSAEAMLEISTSEGETQLVALDGGELRLGRALDNDVVLGDRAASRHHALIRRSGDDFVLVDLGSANGVRLNGRAVESSVLRDHDRMQLGRTELVFRRP